MQINLTYMNTIRTALSSILTSILKHFVQQKVINLVSLFNIENLS